MAKTWFTSDLHFFHSNVILYCNRPYASTKEFEDKVIYPETVTKMNEDMIAKWNEVIAPEDTVYCLGDFSLAFRPVELYTPRLNGYKILVSGNHDWTHPSNRKSRTPERAADTRKKYYDAGWNEIHTNLEIDIDGQKVLLCHLPYAGDTTDDRFPKHRLPDEGHILLCGHVHQHWMVKLTPKNTLMINVGVDVHGMKPVSLDRIKEIIKLYKDNTP